ncbi:c-type cytochrome biogenesis protein CcmI [Candidatus Vondammii sp. HM_W22]|uniref:c-type cytochrome biogenesis protein CcmI n=1 Tax=Candidatus Vondammii sp. HM_W22 TaxID=2687299 RepID=UPI002A4E230F|nr:c-type cytochrome biogenesis protein CcmI [Candidatus Vondammii sp. HM_W22]
MMMFWISTVVMILAALAILAPALLRKPRTDSLDREQQNVAIAREHLAELEAGLAEGLIDQQQFEQSKLELEQSLLFDIEKSDDVAEAETQNSTSSGRMAMGLLAVAIPVLAISIYYQLGSPQLLEPQIAGHGSGTERQGELPSVEEMLATLNTRLAENPDDAEGWYLLGRTQMALKGYAQAAEAYDKVYKLIGDQPMVLLSLADALSMSAGGDMSGRPAELVRKAVKLDLTNTTALWLAAIVEDQSGNYSKSLQYWSLLEPLVEDDPASREQVASLKAKTQQKVGGAANVVQVDNSVVAGQVTAAAISVKLSLAPGLEGKVGPEESMFVFARAIEGPKMPLAVVRLKVKDLPLTVTLSDAQAMTPQMKLSNFKEVLVGARISRSGGPTAGSGDIQGEVAPVKVEKGSAIDLVIDTVVQ